MLELVKDQAKSISHSVTTTMNLTSSERTYRRWLDASTDGEIPRSVPSKRESPEAEPSSKRVAARPVQILTDHHPGLTNDDLRDFEKFSKTPLPEPFRFYPPPQETPAQTRHEAIAPRNRHGALHRSNAVSKRSSQSALVSSVQQGGFGRASLYLQDTQSALPQITAKSDCGPYDSLQLPLHAQRDRGDISQRHAKSELGFYGPLETPRASKLRKKIRGAQ